MSKFTRRFVVGSALFLIMLAICYAKSNAIESVSVQVLDPEKEYRDPSIGTIGAHDKLPDYRLSIIDTDGRTHPLGTHVNTSAAEPLTWVLQEPYALINASSLRLVDEDKLESDVLEEVQITGTEVTGSKYRFKITQTRTFKSGMEYFISTPIGMIVGGAIGLAILIAILAAFAGVAG